MVDISNPEIDNLYKKVLNDEDPTNWAIFTINERNQLEPTGSGLGGMKECLTQLDSSSAQFCVFRVLGIDERGTCTSTRSKFVFVTYLGPDMPSLKKAKVSIQIGPITSHFYGIHLSFQTSDLSDITEEDIVKRLRQCGGAHQPTRYDFGSSSEVKSDTPEIKIETPETKAETPETKIEIPETKAETKTETVIPAEKEPPKEETKCEDNKPEHTVCPEHFEEPTMFPPVSFPKKSPPVTVMDSPAMPVTPSHFKPVKLSCGDIVEATVVEAWNHVLDENIPINCVLCSNTDNNHWGLLHEGPGGFDELKANLVDDKIIFGGFKLLALDEEGSVTSTRTKFIFVSWVGCNIKPFARAKVGMIKNDVHAIFRGTHIDFNCTQLDDLNKEDIIKKLRSSGGAHQPTSYSFEL